MPKRLNNLPALCKFQTVVMSIGENELPYVNVVEQLGSTLRSMNVNVDENVIALAVLNEIASSFTLVILALHATDNEHVLFIFVSVQSRILQKTQRSEIRGQRGEGLRSICGHERINYAS